MQQAGAGEAGRGLRAPKCSRCRNHGFLVPVKGHAGQCRWKQCACRKCHLVTERQKASAAHKGPPGPRPQGRPHPEDRPGPRDQPKATPPPAAPGLSGLSGPSGRPTALGPAGPVRGDHVDLLLPGGGPPRAPPPRAQPGPLTVLLPAAAAAAAAAAAPAGGPNGLPTLADYGNTQPRAVSGVEVYTIGVIAGQAQDTPKSRTKLRAKVDVCRCPTTGPHVVLPECAVGSDIFERDAPRLYTGYPNMYHYQPFALGPSPGQPSYHGGPIISGIPLPRGYYHGHCSMQVPVQDTDGDYHPGFYQMLPQFISPGFLPTVQYMPPPPPPPPSSPLNGLAESSSGADVDPTHSQDSGAECEPSEPPQDQAN
ncbi:doublesex- and mab-3-related transcription factor B1 [Tachyglossus aculeatus]|uniref:doublesex- and mab-3-related transcription factor B1 n=1 Tax=Tachyglossus aculeatus TaxID=9261 RepID=UPI0018F41EC6|nr:doublesex- and mab-3-related transcription factor B1 [Tachyglossus aculeatus]